MCNKINYIFDQIRDKQILVERQTNLVHSVPVSSSARVNKFKINLAI